MSLFGSKTLAISYFKEKVLVLSSWYLRPCTICLYSKVYLPSGGGGLVPIPFFNLRVSSPFFNTLLCFKHFIDSILFGIAYI